MSASPSPGRMRSAGAGSAIKAPIRTQNLWAGPRAASPAAVQPLCGISVWEEAEASQKAR